MAMTTKSIITRILVILTFFTLFACAIIEESEPVAEEKTTRVTTWPPITKGMMQEDSLQVIITYQTNKELMLLHQIKERDGRLVLELTQEDVRALDIPDSLYNEVLDMIYSANGNNN